MSIAIPAERTETTLRSADGTELFVQRWTPPETTVELLVLHGYLEHSARYREFAHAMAAAGIATTTFDHRGHGRSGGRRAFVSDFLRYHEDVDAVFNTISADKPRFILGHSMGGLITLDYVSQRNPPVHGVIVTNPFTAPGGDISALKVQLAKIVGRLVPTFQIAAGLQSELLTHDEELIAAHRRDPQIIHKATAGWGAQTFVAQERVRALTHFPRPLLFIRSDADVVSNWRVNRQLAEQIQAEDKTIVERPGEYHEVLNEVDRAETFSTVRDWITAHK